MTESHDPMCQVPLSYLRMLQERGDTERTRAITWRPSGLTPETEQDLFDGVTPESYKAMQAERDQAIEERDELVEKIAAFEFRAGCALSEIPVEELNKIQDAHVNQQAIDQLKKENERISKECNALGSELCEWRGKYKEAQRELAGEKLFRGKESLELRERAPYGYKKDGTPRKRPGPPPRRRKRAA